MAPRALTLLLLVLAQLFVFGTPVAEAFVRQMDNGTGVPLFWNTRRVVMRPALTSSDDLFEAEIMTALQAAAAEWSFAGDCTDFEVVVGEAATGLESNGLRDPRDGENRVIWREVTWIDNDPSALALTTVRYNPNTGQLSDADIDVNGVDHVWTTADESSPTEADTLNMLTHEIGHVLGFGHTGDPEATMFNMSSAGDIVKRDLGTDDIDAVCSIYPEGRLTPGGPTVGGLKGQTTCGVSGGGHPYPVWLVLIAMVALTWRRTAG